MSDQRRWWTERWLAVLDDAGASFARVVQRGQALARRGRVSDLDLRPGRIGGRVAEERGRPSRVEVRWPTADEAAWDAAVERLSAELRFTAALLEGTLPEGIEEVLAGAGVDLFPDLEDLDASCTCGDASQLCRHVAAVHTVAAWQLDRDPLLLLELRGRGRDRLLRDLRAERGGADETAPGAEPDLSRGLFGARGELDAVPLRPAPVDDPAGLLRHLGPPPGMADPAPLAHLVERAAATAWRLAAGDGTEAADEEVLLTELRAQRVGSAASLAEALGRDEAQVRDDLDRLFEEGTVLRTGSGDQARYRASASSSTAP